MSTLQKQMFIDGAFTSHQGNWIDVVNPSTEIVIARVPEGSVEDARRAIDAAAAAQPAWEALPAVERGVWLHKIASGIRQREGTDRHHCG
ncbi:Lactaldehyde dehydrogenase [Mixta intestinalis]|uniref:Lactaldehyde dehydrogenase n=1 Tax=Mixta intestinalis TaxID=1615494 RepID=A0A6P1PYX4_9GAMM|nr:Lactaldehyde dehydrogenase [Mixta intestinalis]